MVVQMALLGAVLAMLAFFLRRVLRTGSPRRYMVERNGGSSNRQRTTEFHHLEGQSGASGSHHPSEDLSTSIGPAEGVAPLDESVAESNP